MKDLRDKPLKDRLILAAHLYRHTRQCFKTKREAISRIARDFAVPQKALREAVDSNAAALAKG